MNREQKRKEAKKLKKFDVKTTNSETNEISRLIKIAVVVLVIFAIVFFAVSVFITKEIDLNKEKETTENTESNAILANSIFKQKEDVYYVYFYDFDSENTNIATTVINRLQDQKIYYVDTGDILNKNYVVSEGSNKKATSLDDLKVVKDTIIKIDNDKITSYYEGEEDITNNLK